MCSEEYRWKLVDDHLKQFNHVRKKNYHPSERICCDESMSRWYGQGGGWINHGLPCYVAIDRKPENGCEIQNIADGRSGIMMQLKLVKGKDLEGEEDNTGNINHGTKVLLELLRPFSGRNRKAIVCADSYFASVQTVCELWKLGFRFIGVVKTATKQFPMEYLNRVALDERGDCHHLVSKMMSGDDEIHLKAFVWMDRERRYFVSSTGSMREGKEFQRKRWRQIAELESNEAPEKVDITVTQPETSEIYYDVCAKIDQHNRMRQSDLRMEKKLQTKSWEKRVNLSILSMAIVDSYLLYKACTGKKMTQHEYYCGLADEMVENTWSGTPSNVRKNVGPNEVNFGSCGMGVHLTPNRLPMITTKSGTKRKRQMRCAMCSKKTVRECSLCRDDETVDESDSHFCDGLSGRDCFRQHCLTLHS